MMNLNKFQELSRRTMPFNGNPKNDVEFENILGNYSLGLIGEAVEVVEAYQQNMALPGAIENLMKEIGDVTHYAVGVASLFKLQLPDHVDGVSMSVSDLIHDLLLRAKLISEYAKKRIYHRHDDAFDYQALLGIFVTLKSLVKVYGYKYSDVLEMNIDKLKKRYPETFNAEDSINRVDTVQ